MKTMKYIIPTTVALATINAVTASAFRDYPECVLWLWMAWQMIDIYKRDMAWAEFEQLSADAAEEGHNTFQFDVSRLK